ncbi:RagB/SusD family nutrient uptake outer membrane protein [Mucilaginibacter sp.]|jgi:hypothetical protein|uniref:RagB/SusD family nutrient uptake outer membrane protein n=1 Tax=Mucilaginibacter sp. TaxID=1882438 RepID=UPI0035616B12
MKNQKQLLFVIAMGLIASIASCKKFVDIDPPKTQAVSENVFAADPSATAATVGVYNQMVTYNLTYLNGAITVFAGLSADEISNVNPNPSYDVFRTNALLADNDDVETKFWTAAYKYIYQTNSVMEGIKNSTGMSVALKNQLRGEMLFTRALNYYYLVSLFGDVPLLLTADYTVNGSAPRTSTEKIFQQLSADLVEAKQLLADSYGSASNLRPNEMAAAALLARIYLSQKDWTNAEAAATTVISSGNYRLEADVNKVFLNTSAETIFQLGRPSSNTSEGMTFNPLTSSSKPSFMLTASLLNAFQPGDSRRTSWVNKSVANGITYYYPYKYKIRNSTTVTENEVVLRLGEIYLDRAEAAAQQNKLAEALADLNKIRNRAGLGTSPAIRQSDLLQAIKQERQVELFTEWGSRWLDLKRTGTIDITLSVLKGDSWQPSDALYPIPLAEIKLNPFLTQNPGY